MIEIGNYQIITMLDGDGHLTIAVKDKFGSEIIDLNEDVAASDKEFAVRLSTKKIEDKYSAEEFPKVS